MDQPMQNTPRAASKRPKQTIATYSDYADAQKAVDYLSDNDFPVEHTAIVAEGLKFVEQVTGDLNYGKATLNGAASGASTGLFIGLIFGLFGFAPFLTMLAYGLIAGAIAGVLLGVIGYAMTGGKRDFTSVGGMQAETYNVMVDNDYADRAEQVLAGLR